MGGGGGTYVSHSLMYTTRTHTWLGSTLDSRGDISWVQKAALQLYRRDAHSSTHPGTSLHMTQFYQAFRHISSAWGCLMAKWLLKALDNRPKGPRFQPTTATGILST